MEAIAKNETHLNATVEPVISKEMQDAPDSDMSSPPLPHSSQSEEPPPYSAALEMDPPPKSETIPQPGSGYESLAGIGEQDATDTTSIKTTCPFDDKAVRRGFIRKVFCILTLQLLFTFSVVCVFTFSSVVKKAVQENLWAYISSVIIFMVVAITLSFLKSFSRRHPWNIVGLAVVTVSLSYMVGTVASFYDTRSVIITMGATLAITVTVIAFSAQTRFDFTICYGLLLILAVDLIMFGFFSIFYYHYITDICYGCLGALLYSLFLIIDCQLMMGMMSNRVDPEEYINAALLIYLDVVLIFLYLLGRS
uniref:Uncharacterized protein n=1 Tax=Monopterus albus TaxID=43700 RepID=A0A3Q3JUU8_MONAL|nr:protein lifeguard 1-like isoform X2 [Monopterus albus]